jgi:hypothetical protein
MDSEIVTVELGKGKIVLLTLTPFSEIDVDDITRIHYNNVMGEILTCPVLLNRIGNLLAEADNILAEAKLDLEIYYAQKEEELRKEHTTRYTNSRAREVIEKPGSTEVEQMIYRTPQYAVKKKHVLKLQKQRDIINSLYWAVKDKSDKVSRISDKLRPEEFEKDIIDETINGILIKTKKRSIK